MLEIVTAAVRASLVTWILLGILYPLAVTGLGQWLLPSKAGGSLLKSPDGTIIGSRLIGQQWNGPEWFHGRPSATTGIDPNDPARMVPSPYNAASSGGSNLGPTSQALMARLQADRERLEQLQPELTGKRLPADMLTASASGLDPDVSPANAALQVHRVARARGVSVPDIDALLRKHVAGRGVGIFGEPHVNVLELNLALERAWPTLRRDSGRR